MGLYLRAGVHAAAIGADLVLLDVADDSYLCLPDGAPDVRPGPDGVARVRPGAVERALVEAGLLSPTPPPATHPLPDRAIRSVIHQPLPRPSARDVGAALGAVRDVHDARRGGGIAAYLERRPSRCPLRRDHAATLDAARRFWRLSPWLPVEGECLVRSALLIGFLHRSGLQADWMFGVRLWPFMAHCWVQSGDVCLNDDFERLAPYTPILRR